MARVGQLNCESVASKNESMPIVGERAALGGELICDW